MTNREKLSASFWCGWTAMLGFEMARQDLLGLDRYLAAVRSNWINTPWWLGCLVVVASLLLYGVLRSRTK